MLKNWIDHLFETSLNADVSLSSANEKNFGSCNVGKGPYLQKLRAMKNEMNKIYTQIEFCLGIIYAM